MSDRAGKEVPKEYRAIVNHQVDRFGWRYDASGKGYPQLYPTDRTKRPIAVPKTPSDHRGIKNFIGKVRNAGGEWPPGRSR